METERGAPAIIPELLFFGASCTTAEKGLRWRRASTLKYEVCALDILPYGSFLPDN